MVVAPAGSYSLPVKHLRDSYSNSAAFRTWTGTADVSAALLRIHYFRKGPTAVLPFIIVGFGDDYRRERIADQGAFMTEGSLDAIFRETVAAETTDADAVFGLTNTISAIMAQLEASSRIGGGYLDFHTWHISMGPDIVKDDDDKAQGEAQYALAIVTLEVEGV